MITRTASRWQTTDWQFAMKTMIRSLDTLCDALDLSISDLNGSYQAEADFPVKVPLSYLQLIEKGNPNDPLLLQVLPQIAETLETSIFEKDPLHEAEFNKAPGLIHKYHGRALLISNPSCAIHCRYCFRRHFPYDENTPGINNWQAALSYISENTSIHEVILSGGDPLSNNDNTLEKLIDQIAAIPHVTTLRFHTRLPTIIPERITDSFLSAISQTNLKLVMVLHINHAQEINNDVIEAIQLLKNQGIRLLNQSVLLKDVNDNLEAQRALMEQLHLLDIQAYYLHMLDHVRGAEHFLVSDNEANTLYKQLLSQLPGYMLPKLVRETPFESNKTPII